MRECQLEGCRTQARFNRPGEPYGIFCNVHKEAGMRNVMHKPCAAVGCYMQAVFNMQGELRGMYCSKHKLEGMVEPGPSACGCCVTLESLAADEPDSL